MGDVFFYHLTASPLEALLPSLLAKSRSEGWRVVVRGKDDETLNWLDETLWLKQEGFAPHGRAGSGFDADQPVLLTSSEELPNKPDCLVSIYGAPIEASEVEAMTRSMVIFDGNSDAAVEFARGQWKDLTGAGCPAQYWSQATGKWEMKAKHPS